MITVIATVRLMTMMVVMLLKVKIVMMIMVMTVKTVVQMKITIYYDDYGDCRWMIP